VSTDTTSARTNKPDAKTTVPSNHYLPWIAAVIFFVASVMVALFFAVLSPSVAHDLSLNQSQLGLLGGIYFIVYSVGQLVLGSVLGPVSPRLILSSTAIVTAVGSFLFAISTSLPLALAGQVLMGFGLSSTFVGVVYVIGRDLPQRFSFMTALSQALSNIVGALVAVLAGVTSLFAEFRGPFYFASVLFLAAAVALIFFIGGKNKSEIAVEQAEDRMPFGVVLKECGLSTQFWAALVYYSCLFGTILAYSGLWNMQFQINFFGNTTQQASLLNAMIPLGITLGSIIAGIWAQRRGDFVLPARTFGLLSVIIVLLMWLFDVSHQVALAANFILGLGLAGSILALSVVQAHVKRPAQAMGTALVITAAFVTGGVIQPIVGIVVDLPVRSAALYWLAEDSAELVGLTATSNPDFGTYQQGFEVMGAFVILGFLSSLMFRSGASSRR